MEAIARTPVRSGSAVDRVQSDLVQIADRLAQLAGQLVHDVEKNAPDGLSRMSYLDFARRLIDDRRERNERFGAELFSDPAWDILLDLFVAAGERKKVSVSSVSIGAAVPLTTALRWITTLTDSGMLTREQDPFDRRRVHIALTDSAFSNVKSYLDSVARRWGIVLQGMVDPVMM